MRKTGIIILIIILSLPLIFSAPIKEKRGEGPNLIISDVEILNKDPLVGEPLKLVFHISNDGLNPVRTRIPFESANSLKTYKIYGPNGFREETPSIIYKERFVPPSYIPNGTNAPDIKKLQKEYEEKWKCVATDYPSILLNPREYVEVGPIEYYVTFTKEDKGIENIIPSGSNLVILDNELINIGIIKTLNFNITSCIYQDLENGSIDYVTEEGPGYIKQVPKEMPDNTLSDVYLNINSYSKEVFIKPILVGPSEETENHPQLLDNEFLIPNLMKGCIILKNKQICVVEMEKIGPLSRQGTYVSVRNQNWILKIPVIKNIFGWFNKNLFVTKIDYSKPVTLNGVTITLNQQNYKVSFNK